MEDKKSLVAGIDEVGKGCLFGPVYAGAVIWEKNKDFAAADSLRQELESQGWKVLDSKDGYTIEAL